MCTRAWLKLASFCRTYSERHKIFYDKVRTSETAGNNANVQIVIIFAEMGLSSFYAHFIDYKHQLNDHIYGQTIILEIKSDTLYFKNFRLFSVIRRSSKSYFFSDSHWIYGLLSGERR